MDLHYKKISTIIVALVFPVIMFCQPQGQETDLSNWGGSFKPVVELVEVNQLIDSGKTEQALGKLLAIVNKPVAEFKDERRAYFIKGTAAYTLGELHAESGQEEKAINYFKIACDNGNPNAPMQVAGHILIMARNSNNNEEIKKALQESKVYTIMGAELGDNICIDWLCEIYKNEKNIVDGNYWLMLKGLGEHAEDIARLDSFYNLMLNNDDRAGIVESLISKGLSGGPNKSQIIGIPGRSALNAAYVDFNMRKMLSFVWQAFFAEKPQQDSHPMNASFDVYSKTFETGNPYCKVYLGVNNSFVSKKKDFGFNNEDVSNHLLPGDQILSNCGDLNHYAVVWQVDKEHNKILLLDPFAEFWQPSHNDCIKKLKMADYKYTRRLVELDLKEMSETVVAIFTLRDKL